VAGTRYAVTPRVYSDAVISCSNHEETGLEALSSLPYQVPAHDLRTHIKPLVGTNPRSDLLVVPEVLTLDQR
jgi:hypothetical protein